jgi:hypothetical protein
MVCPRILICNIFASSVMVLCVALMAGAQQPAGSDGRTAEQMHKNIQVLQGTPADLFLPEMRLL